MKLSTKDIKLIKYEKRIGYVFSSGLFVLGIIWNLSYLTSSENGVSYLMILINLAIIIVCLLIPYFMNRKYNLDIKYGIKSIKVEAVQNKEELVDYEPGSGKLYIPILGDLFPKQWGQKMRKVHKFVLIIDGAQYNIDKNLFDKVKKGDEVEMYYAKYSEMFLGIDKKRK